MPVVITRIFIAALVAGAACSSCSKPPTAEANNQNAPHPPVPPREIEACALLTAEEVASVQGEPVVNTTSGNAAGGGFATAHCVFSTATPVNSVSLVVVQSSGKAGARSVPEFWRDTFHERARAEGGDDEEREKEAAPPKNVPDLGDEAFWIGTESGTPLYVLKGDAYIQISVGGAGGADVRLEKARKLAQSALKRL